MLRFDLLSWWYLKGWPWSVRYFFIERNTHIIDIFSVKEVSRTLFAPYRQTFAGATRGGLGDKFRAFIDRTISRAIGFVIRFFLILTGIVFICLNSLVGIIVVIGWPLVPLTPVIGLVVLVMGVVSEL